MKKVKSLSALKGSALSRGASLEIGNTRFNTTFDKVKPVAKKPPEPPQAPPEPPPPPPSPAPTPQANVILDVEPIAKAIETGNEKLATAIASALKRDPVETVAPTKPTSWTFKINRDLRGYIESVEATPSQA